MKVEEWRPAPGYVGLYEVSSWGAIRSVDRTLMRRDGKSMPCPGVLLRQRPNRYGYPEVQLYLDGRQKRHRVHVLVAGAFLQRGPGQIHVRHLNGDPSDNRLENLAYGTASENGLDTVLHGRNQMANKTHCVNGHEFTPENTATRRDRPRHRVCRECARANGRRVYRNKRGMAA